MNITSAQNQMNPGSRTANEILPGHDSQVEAQMNILECEIRDNSEIVARLNDRLSAVTRPQPPEPITAGNKQSPEEMLVPHAERIRAAFRSLRNQNIEMRRILDAIEL